MCDNPIPLFQDWYASALDGSPLKHPAAVCVSTVGPDGVPESRFVALKAVSDAGFVFCTAWDSPKGVAIAANANVGLTFWWDHIERQVRVNGTATPISDADADRYFRERTRGAQLATVVSQQSEPLESQAALAEKLQQAEASLAGKDVPRPADWGGYLVRPARLEFLEFQANRMHHRVLFTRTGSDWSHRLLQP